MRVRDAGGLSAGSAPCLEVIRQRYPGLRIVILTRLENAGVVHMLLSRGVHCIVSKVDELSHLLPAILRARGDGRYLSPRIEALAQAAGYGRAGLLALTLREMEVVRLFLAGLTVNEIAQRLDRSKKTISTQKGTAMLKLGVQSDIELLRYGIETGLADARALPCRCGRTNSAPSRRPAPGHGGPRCARDQQVAMAASVAGGRCRVRCVAA